MAEEIKVGDIVQLKSGGPKMTVESVESYSGNVSAHCVWFEGTKRTDGAFKPATLIKV